MSFRDPSYWEAAMNEFAVVSRHLGVCIETEIDDPKEIRTVSPLWLSPVVLD